MFKTEINRIIAGVEQNLAADLVSSANADRLDIRRPNAASHLAMGSGRHFCLGAHLARLEVRAICQELLSRLEFIELAGTPTFVHSTLVSGPKTLPVRYRLR